VNVQHGQGVSHPCPYCEGVGSFPIEHWRPGGPWRQACVECGATGERVSTTLDAGDGITARVSGNAPLSPESEEALREVARAAAKHLEDH